MLKIAMGKKVALAMVSTVVGAALVGGASFALFTGSATNDGNTFTAGTVVLTDKTNGSVASQEQYATKLAPGDTKALKMTVKNEGNLAEWVKIDDAATQASASGDLFQIDANHMTLTSDSSVVLLQPGDTHDFTVTYLLPQAAGNSYQGKSGSFKVVVDSVQARNNTNANNDGPVSWN